MIKPNFQKLWLEFPDHTKYPSMKDLYTALGGVAEKNINAPGFGPNGNTCASRLSVAFNKTESPISTALANTAGVQTIGTADGSRIIYRVSDFRKYLLKVFGNPTYDDASPYDSEFRHRKGIIAFSVNWEGATGHIALWNGFAYREPDHDNYATYVHSAFPNIKTTRGEFWGIS